MLSHSPDLAANILKSSVAEKRCYRCQRAVFFNGCDCVEPGPLQPFTTRRSTRLERNDLFHRLRLLEFS